jgi:DNA-directed RNA polymerase specialized sigma24 family protein
MLTLNAEERSIRNASDSEITQWLKDAKGGNRGARDKLCRWAYFTASEYYHSKVSSERHFTFHDAEELTSQFYLEFEQTLPRIRTATHFTRRLLSRMLGRYINRERHRHLREASRATFDDILVAIDESVDPPWNSWTDHVWRQYRATLRELQFTDAITRRIIECRVGEVKYAQIAEEINLSEAAVRMRVARFYKAVRRRFTIE